MAVFSFIDEGSVPGCAALKLCDGRKRSMSLWVEFITASGRFYIAYQMSMIYNISDFMLHSIYICIVS